MTTRTALLHSRFAAFVADVLIRLESLAGDINVDSQECRLYHVPMAHLRTSCFQNDEHCEYLTRFMKYDLLDLFCCTKH